MWAEGVGGRDMGLETKSSQEICTKLFMTLSFPLVRNKSYLCHAFTCVLGITVFPKVPITENSFSEKQKNHQNWEVLDASFHNFFFCVSFCLPDMYTGYLYRLYRPQQGTVICQWPSAVVPGAVSVAQAALEGNTVLHKASYCNAKKQHSKKLRGGWCEHRQANGCRCWFFFPMLHSSRPYHSLPKEIFSVEYLFVKNQFWKLC